MAAGKPSVRFVMTPADLHPGRSYSYFPGTEPVRLPTSRARGAAAVIVDLQDALAIGERASVTTWPARLPAPDQVRVRTDADSPAEDVAVLAGGLRVRSSRRRTRRCWNGNPALPERFDVGLAGRRRRTHPLTALLAEYAHRAVWAAMTAAAGGRPMADPGAAGLRVDGPAEDGLEPLTQRLPAYRPGRSN